MTYVLQLAQEPPVEFNEQLIKSLHFMMTSYDLKNRPGRWRLGPIFVRDDEADVIVQEGADIAEVDRLMKKLVTYMTSPSNEADVIRGAMVHLNLVMVHPFRDGNGRMARSLHSLMLASGDVLSPIFMSIEEYLGRNTRDYYDILASVGGGSWAPERDTRPWIRFVLTAHLRQALTLQRRIRGSERVWSELERIIEQRKLPDRMIHALFDAVVGFRVRNSIYRATLVDAEKEISEQTASRDFKVMTDLELLATRGERRGRYYVRSGALSEVYESVLNARTARDNSDPFTA